MRSIIRRSDSIEYRLGVGRRLVGCRKGLIYGPQEVAAFARHARACLADCRWPTGLAEAATRAVSAEKVEGASVLAVNLVGRQVRSGSASVSLVICPTLAPLGRAGLEGGRRLGGAPAERRH